MSVEPRVWLVTGGYMHLITTIAIPGPGATNAFESSPIARWILSDPSPSPSLSPPQAHMLYYYHTHIDNDAS
jgi:hypothetical protein